MNRSVFFEQTRDYGHEFQPWALYALISALSDNELVRIVDTPNFNHWAERNKEILHAEIHRRMERATARAEA